MAEKEPTTFPAYGFATRLTLFLVSSIGLTFVLVVLALCAVAVTFATLVGK